MRTRTFTTTGPLSLSVADAGSVTEGDAGSRNASFVVSLSAPAPAGGVTVHYATADGSATAPSDYGQTSGALSFAPGETSKTVAVAVHGDTSFEGDETFSLVLSAPAGAGIADDQGSATILDDDPAPAPSVATGAATGVTTGSARLTGTVNPQDPVNGLVWAFEWGTGTSYGSVTPSRVSASGTVDQSVAENLAGLAQHTTYHYRLVGYGSGSAVYRGTDRTFTTLPRACEITQSRSLEGTTTSTIEFVNATGGPVRTYWLDYAGQRVLYETIPAGQSFVQDTWLTHPWVVLDAADGCVGYTVSDRPAKRFVVGEAVSVADAPPLLEGDAGSRNASFVVSLSSPAPAGGVTVDYATADGSATAPSDYAAASGTLSFAPGETSKTVAVAVHGDTAFEGDETFTLRLSGAGATVTDGQGTATIRNDDVERTGTPAPGVADLRVTAALDSAAPLVAGHEVSYRATVSNAGPGVATGVVLRVRLSASLRFVSAARGACAQSGSLVTCSIGGVGAAERHGRHASAGGVVGPRVGGGERGRRRHRPGAGIRPERGAGGGGAGSAAGRSDRQREPGVRPGAGQAARESAGSCPWQDARSLPVGTVVDATRGRVRITSAADGHGHTQSAEFSAGQFRIAQRRARPLITELVLVGGDFAGCRRGRAAPAAAARRRGHGRRLWGSGKGKFRTRGRYGAATVRGTRWLTEDRCDDTRVLVARGVVSVRDFPRRRTVIVRAGRSYVARAPR